LIGKKLAHYEILARIGAGGMGEVYRARDGRLGRDVAVKVLPPELALDAGRRARFEREAAVVAGLNHPNIVTLHSVEEEEGLHFLTMELVEGRTLTEVVPAAGLGIEELLKLAVPLTDAVAAAHEKGIVHRDLKPANVMVDGAGRVKVLDFGLAKLAEAGDGSEDTATSDGATQAGQLLGTVAYMSPEQAEGLAVDARSDVFSLGVLLYQMATGRHPFQRATTVSTLSAILKDMPQPAPELKSSLPAELGSILERCLQKEPGRRYASARELRDRLEDLQTTVVSGTLAARARPTRPGALGGRRLAIPLVVLLLGAIALATWLYRRSARITWAREVALPQIEVLLDAAPWTGGPGTWEAYQLGRQAEGWIPGDPLLERLARRYSSPVTLASEPAGARVLAKPYGLEGEEWELLGTTPLAERPFVAGVLRIRLEKQGYEPVEDLYWARLFKSKPPGYRLLPAGSLPEGMAWVSGSAPRLEIDAAPAGIHLPGIEHLPSRELGDFFVDRHEVTNREYKRFVDAGGYERPELWKEPFVEGTRNLSWQEAIGRFVDRTGRPGPATWEVGDYPEGLGDHPVTGVSWFEAAAFAEYAGKQLPTIYHWDQVALTWASADIVPPSNLGGSGTRPVGTGAATNRFGTSDLGGNAREWCVNASSRGDRFILGGGWNDPAYAFNDAFAQSPWDRSETNGFRCIQNLESSGSDPALAATIELPFRDFLSEPTVSDETFALFLAQFRYDAAPLHAEIEETREEEDYVRQRIAFDAAYGGERMSAYLFLPKHGTPPYQTVVLFPGSGAIHTRSSEDLGPGRALFVVKGGRALIQPIYKSTYERGDGLVSDYPDTTNHWKEHVVMWGKDLRRTLDYVETRDDLDAGRIAYFGLSWGSAMAPMMIAVEPRIRAGVLVVAGLNFQKALPEVDEVHYARRVDIPILMLNGKYDFFFPYETSQLPFFELLATPDDQKKLVVDEGSHAFPPTALAREALAWLDQYLGPVP